MFMEEIVTIVSNRVYFTYLWDLQPTFIRVVIHLLSTMDIPVKYVLDLRVFDAWKRFQNNQTLHF